MSRNPLDIPGVITLQALTRAAAQLSLCRKPADRNSSPTLSYTASALPTGLSMDISTGVISGTIALGAGNLGAFAPTITVSDGTSSSSTSFNWNVASAVSITPIADQQNTEGESVSLAVSATDLNSSLTLSYTASGLPTGLSIDTTTGAITGTIVAGAANLAPYTTTIMVGDGTSSASTSFIWSIVSNITISPISNQHNHEGDSVSLTVSATDSNSSATLSYSASGLPAGVTIDASTGAITGTIAAGAANAGPYSTTVFVTDGVSSANKSFVWFVTSNISIALIPNQFNDEGDSVSLTVSASDTNSSATLSFSASGLPAGLTISNTTGVISGTIAVGAGNIPVYTTTVTVTDGISSTSKTFNWHVVSNVWKPSSKTEPPPDEILVENGTTSQPPSVNWYTCPRTSYQEGKDGFHGPIPTHPPGPSGGHGH